MKIEELDSAFVDRFNELALMYGTIFQTTYWTSVVDRGLKHYGIFDNGSQLIGGFFIYHEKKAGMTFYHNPSFTPSIGPFLKIDAKNVVNVTNMWKEALALLADFFDNLSYSVMSYSLNKNVIDTQPFIWKKFKVIPGYTYILDLSIENDQLLKNMSNERRKNIKKGIKDNLIVRKETDFRIVKYLVSKTYSRQNMKLNSVLLDKILFEFANYNNSFAFVTYNGETAIACTFSVYDKHSAYYILGGYDYNLKHHGGGSLSMWESIKYAKSMGLNSFDFEGSMVPQIERYFRGFGGRLTPYYRINKAKLPIEIILKFFKRELF